MIAELFASGRLALDAASSLRQGKVTYHDPCYFDCYNSVYDAPRNVLHVLPATDLTEMPRSRNHSFCCGGGGRAMMKEQSGTRINQDRVREALNSGAEVVAAACPFCMDMLEDGIGSLDAASKLRVLDLAELVAGSLEASTSRSGNGRAVS